MWARKRLDIGWLDLAFAMRRCLLPAGRSRLQEAIERRWSPAGGAGAAQEDRKI